MKKIIHFVFVCAAAFSAAGCFKDGESTVTFTSEDENLQGTAVTSGETSGSFYKLFVLNEGQWEHNNASLDFLRFSTGLYVTNAFNKMNDKKVLGDTANDMMVYYNYLFIAVHNSGLIEVVNALNEREITYIPIPAPRSMAVYGEYLYVTSYAGNVREGDRLGRVYRINLNYISDRDSVEVGYQPEGIAATSSGEVYVANSGGFHPGFDNRITVLDAATLRTRRTIEVAPNLDKVYYDYSADAVWVTSMGDFESNPTGLYRIGPNHAVAPRSADLSKVRVTCSTICADGYIYSIGTDTEFDFGAASHSYTLYKVRASTGEVTEAALPGGLIHPYSLCVNPLNGDIYIGEAGDYVNPGTVFCYDKDLKQKWQADAGVIPGKMALYSIYYSL